MIDIGRASPLALIIPRKCFVRESPENVCFLCMLGLLASSSFWASPSAAVCLFVVVRGWKVAKRADQNV